VSSSRRYESWITQIPLPWMGRVGRKIWGAFSAVLGDFALDWGQRANLEHCPEFASADAVALIANERQLDQGPNESTAAFATRLTKAYQAWKYAGRPYGLLVALYAQGYTNVVLVQQNGLGYKLTQAPTFVPTSDMASFDLATLTAPFTSMVTPGYSVPQGIPWWTIDNNPEFCSRFVILFLNALPASWTNVVSPPTGATAPTLSEVNRIHGLISKWRPAKATCVGFYAQVSGKMLGWDFTLGDPLGGVTVFFPTP